MDFRTLKKELDGGKFRHFYVFTGEETEVMLKYIQRVAGGDKVEKASSFESIAGRLKCKGLFNTRKVYVINNDKSIQTLTLEQILEAIGSTSTVILTYDTIDGRVKFFKNIKDCIVEFKKFTSEQLANYVRMQVNIPDDLAVMVAGYCGNDVARIEMETHKLKYLDGEITSDVINEIITPPAEDKVFEMVECVVTKKAKRAFDLYLDLLELKESPIKLLSLMYTKFRQVFLVQCLAGSNLQNVEICAKADLTPFQLHITKGLIGAFTPDQLLEALRKIQQTEVAVKSGKVEQLPGFENLLINILTV